MPLIAHRCCVFTELTFTALFMRSVLGKSIIHTALWLLVSHNGWAQFYQGMHHPFGKNRVQHEQFDWQKMEYDRFTVYFYGEGKNTAVYTARVATDMIAEMEQFFDFNLQNERLLFVVYQKIEHFRQSNVGIPESSESNIGGVTQLAGNKVFVHFTGDLNELKTQVRRGLASVLIGQMMFGDNWREMLKNSALLNFPAWYVDGLTWFAAENWSVAADDRLRDMVLRGDYKNFNRLQGVDGEVAGRSLWHYVSETYGTKVIPNIIYMARMSRNVESGFLFVLGINMKTLLSDAQQYYQNRYERDAEGTTELAAGTEVKTKKKLGYSAPALNSELNTLAYTTHLLGKTTIRTTDLTTGRTRCLLRQGYKLQRVTDQSYPVLAWNHMSNRLLAVSERNGKIWLYQFDERGKRTDKSEILRLEKVLEMQVNEDGTKVLMSVVNKGQSDVVLYSLAARNYSQITNDVYDDRYPAFWDGDRVVFSSNRFSDTLGIKQHELGELPAQKFDLFSLPLAGDENRAQRLTNTPNVNETHPTDAGNKRFAYLGDASGTVSHHSGYLDSAVLRVDTAITYRYFTRTQANSAFERSVQHTNTDALSGEVVDVFRKNGRTLFTINSAAAFAEEVLPANTAFSRPVVEEPKAASAPEGIRIRRIKVFDEPAPQAIDINNYTFEADPTLPADNSTTAPPIDTITTRGVEPFSVPEQRNYDLAFAATDFTSQFDFGFATDVYQTFNGGPYVNPGLGTYFKIGMLDVFEDYKIDGGFRYSFNQNLNEFFVSFDDRSKRIDRRFIGQRMAMRDETNYVKTTTYQAKGIFRYPFTEVSAMQLTASGRYDRQVQQAGDQTSLEKPDVYTYWAGLKLEYIFDNTLNRGLNILNGSRAKVFAEHYQNVIDPNTDFSVLGLDARHYIPIYRDLIWANRIAASSSFGSRKLVYYMGGVDNWIVLGGSGRFDQTTTIATDQGYAFQTIATNMRGFLQNARNGNNFAVLNSEVRWPFVKFFTNSPIKNEFLANMQAIAFGDFGSAWNGPDPYADENAFNSIVEETPAVKVTYENQSDPFIGSVGWGVRTKLWGYFVRYDQAWGIENGIVLGARSHFSLGLDF